MYKFVLFKIWFTRDFLCWIWIFVFFSVKYLQCFQYFWYIQKLFLIMMHNAISIRVSEVLFYIFWCCYFPHWFCTCWMKLSGLISLVNLYGVWVFLLAWQDVVILSENETCEKMIVQENNSAVKFISPFICEEIKWHAHLLQTRQGVVFLSLFHWIYIIEFENKTTEKWAGVWRLTELEI